MTTIAIQELRNAFAHSSVGSFYLCGPIELLCQHFSHFPVGRAGEMYGRHVANMITQWTDTRMRGDLYVCPICYHWMMVSVGNGGEVLLYMFVTL